MLVRRLKNIFLHRRMLIDMTLSGLKSKYAGSALGLWWAVATPLIVALSINFVFNLTFKIEVKNYTVFVLAGIIPWFFAVNALTEATTSLIINGPLIRQNIFPREFLIISSVLANFINFLIGLLILSPFFIITNAKVVMLFPALLGVTLLHLLFILGLGMIFSVLNVYLRDLSHFLSTVFMGWFWITPVFYSFDMLKPPFDLICKFNPMTYYTILYQDILFSVKLPYTQDLLMSCGLSLVLFVCGYLLFLRNEAALLKRI